MAESAGNVVQEGVIKELGLLAFKTMITLNSGAFIVLLTFLGNADLSTEAFVVSIQRLKLALVFFLVGISATLLGILLSYVAAQLTASGSDAFRGSVRSFLFWMTTPAIISALSFVGGVCFAITAINPI